MRYIYHKREAEVLYDIDKEKYVIFCPEICKKVEAPMKLYTREEEIQAVKGFIAGLEEIDAFKEADDLNKTMSDFLSMLKPPEKKEEKE
jgi:hypothetical protein